MKPWELGEMGPQGDENEEQKPDDADYFRTTGKISIQREMIATKVAWKMGGRYNYPQSKTGAVVGLDSELPKLGFGYRGKDV